MSKRPIGATLDSWVIRSERGAPPPLASDAVSVPDHTAVDTATTMDVDAEGPPAAEVCAQPEADVLQPEENATDVNQIRHEPSPPSPPPSDETSAIDPAHVPSPSLGATAATEPQLPSLPAEATLPASYADAWDRDHVRLPCSPRCVVGRDREPFWPLLCRALHPAPTSTLTLIGRLCTVKKAMRGDWNFRALHELLEHELDEGQRRVFFETTLPHMCRLALSLPHLCAEPLPLLLAGRPRCVEISPELCASLVAHAFFCSMPGRANDVSSPHLPYFGLHLLHSPIEPSRFAGSNLGSTQAEKWRCLLQYFSAHAASALAAPRPPPLAGEAVPTVAGAGPSQDTAAVQACERLLPVDPSRRERWVRFERRVLDTSDYGLHDGEWSTSNAPLCALEARAAGTIEDDGEGMLQLDFANKMVGGGVLRRGCVQEEIRFLICPELIVSRLITECLAENEALLVTNFSRYSDYTGYAATFRYAGPAARCPPSALAAPHDDDDAGAVELPPSLPPPKLLLAIDATRYDRRIRARQYEAREMER